MRIYKSKYRKAKFRLIWLIISLSVLLITGCRAVKPASVPKPSDGFYTGDFAGVISSETERYICSYAAALEKLTGSQIVIVTASELNGFAIDRYASDIFNSWGIGSSKENNGVLLVMAVAEEQYWIIQGSGLEEYLSSAVLKSMLNEYLEPYFAGGDYDSGAKNMFDAVYSKLCSYYSVVPQTESLSDVSESFRDSAPGIFFNVLLACALLIIVIILFRRILRRPLRKTSRRRRRGAVRKYGTHTARPSNRAAADAGYRRNSVRESDAVRRSDRGLSHSETRTKKIKNSDAYSGRADSGRRINRR